MISSDTIVRRAAAWYERGCIESRANRGVCVDEIHTLFDPKWVQSKRAEAWCAKFVWVVFEEAARQSGEANPLPRTAGARDMLVRAKKTSLRVDNLPQEGDVFYRRSSSPGATGHVGIVTEVTSDGITTCEGNLDNRVAYYHYSWQKINDPSWDFAFIHASDPSSAGGVLQAGSNGLLVVLLCSAAAGWYFSQRKGKKR